jgi:hypothetical protein
MPEPAGKLRVMVLCRKAFPPHACEAPPRKEKDQGSARKTARFPPKRQEQAMKSKSLVTVILLLGSGVAFADEKIDTVQVRPGSYALDVSCSNTEAISPAAVERVLQINDRSQTAELGNKLEAAAAEACRAGVETIVVSRSASGHSLNWSAGREVSASVASN